jgi:c-di-GMP-binding flagellar brake protein YcgR
VADELKDPSKDDRPVPDAGDECIWSAPGSSRQRVIQRRHSVDTTAIIRLIDLAADLRGHIVDISLGGCRMRTERRFPLGIFRRVEVEFRIEGLPFRLGGVTQTIHDPFNVGIRFLDLSDRKREQLLQLIDEIRSSEPHPDP